MYQPEHIGTVIDTEGREITFSVDHGAVRMDAGGLIFFLDPNQAADSGRYLYTATAAADMRRKADA